MRSFFETECKFKNPFFIGTVEDNNDPTFSYRVKVRIDILHPATIKTENLPWAARVDSAFMGMSDSADLDHKVPEVGSKVLVLCIGNDINSLVYLGCLYKKTPQTPAAGPYLNTYGIYIKNGQFIGIDKVQKLFQMLFEGDVNIDKVTNMTIKVSNAVKIECQNANVKASSVILDTPLTTMTGDLKVNGMIDADGNIKSAAEVSAKSGSVNLSTHTHQYEMGGTAAGPNTTQPGQG